jgi:hypothetical protein
VFLDARSDARESPDGVGAANHDPRQHGSLLPGKSRRIGRRREHLRDPSPIGRGSHDETGPGGTPS